MAWDLALWILSFLAVAAALGIIVYQLLCLSDLEFDFINPFDSSSRINRFVLPEFAIQGVLSAIYLIFGYWLMFLLNAPLLYYNIRLYMSKRHLVDVTEIFNQLEPEKKIRFYKLGFYLSLLCIVIYRMLLSVI
ncbi:protein cornichon homolog 4 isoform X2 [Selaginella moellendorffii]|uniref:protein cornichon homolog 4 isoform X2 n=1 Tax=Selaginella moellendorffii TaxID=88036 RepID=UPI000D1C5CF2|nr:protein cornichon homolog 4 isoform X2 [Selaginella moellendorffii]XP_024539292.1 protein cornichon homolog 4 isoform X2 [Selaginella moellendorffii]|eukprot:XP_024531120.1 protein cornichon homolog 4 isoform X2 [Selaginella moellendorffii]